MRLNPSFEKTLESGTSIERLLQQRRALSTLDEAADSARLLESGGASGGTLDTVSLVGKQATVAPNLPAGKYAALVINGKVYVARFHNVAWELAGRKGIESFYGFAEIDAAGKVIRLFK